MNNNNFVRFILMFITLGACVILCAHELAAQNNAAPASSFPQSGRQLEKTQLCDLVQKTGIKGGILVHLGCGTGEGTAAMQAAGTFIIQGLDTSPEKIKAAREYLFSINLYGRMSVLQWVEARLPYTDSLVNIIVADDLSGITEAELMRVLVPNGVALIRRGDKWEKLAKAKPADIDEWQNFFYDASGNPLSKDMQVGPPRRLKWTAGPSWLRSHEANSSFVAMVSAGGRIYYVFDEGQTSIVSPMVPERWTLLCRDAYNGILLWKKPLATWGMDAWRSKSLRHVVDFTGRRIVAAGDFLYVTLEYAGPLYELDGKTGAVVRKLAGTEGTQEVLLQDDILFINRINAGKENSVSCIQRSSGKTLWETKTPKISLTTLASDGKIIAYFNGREIIGINALSGERKWAASPDFAENKTKAKSKIADANADANAVQKAKFKKEKASKNDEEDIQGDGKLLVCNQTVIFAGAKELSAFDADSGAPLWKVSAGGGAMRPEDTFVSQGNVWHSGKGGTINGFNLRDGNVTATIDPSPVNSAGHHNRCYPAKATENYLITQFRGVEFVSLTNMPSSQNDWMRGACAYGIMPANGLLYTPPHPCFCYGSAMMLALNAYETATDTELNAIGSGQSYGPLIKGASFGQVAPKNTAAGEWPMYRRENSRSGSISVSVAERINEKWTFVSGTRSTPPVASDGRIFIALKEHHSIAAIAADTGKEIWRFTADGVIDSSPSIWGTAILFGSADGFIYCLDAKTGGLAWKRRLAPSTRFIVNQEHLESAWRIHGSVLVYNDTVYTIAGRSTFLDGGLFLYGIDTKTGEVKYSYRFQTLFNERDDAKGKVFNPAFVIEGSRSDLLVAQNGHIYLNQFVFTPELKPVPMDYVTKEEVAGVRGLEQAGTPYVNEEAFELKWKGTLLNTSDAKAARGVLKNTTSGVQKSEPHLSAKSGFLDDSLFLRTYWIYADTYPGFNHTIFAPKSGNILVFGRDMTFAAKLYTSQSVNSPLYDPDKGCLIVADRNDNEPIIDERSFMRDKGMGMTRKVPPVWSTWIHVRVQAMLLAGNTLYVAGPPDVINGNDPMAAFEGRLGGKMYAFSAADGTKISEYDLKEPPAFDGLMSADGNIFYITDTGRLICMAGE